MKKNYGNTLGRMKRSVVAHASSRGFLLIAVTIFCGTILSCNTENTELPPSVTIGNNIITFHLRDEGYRRVMIGSNILGVWGLAEMEKSDSLWSYATYIDRKKIEYKFFIDDSIWMTDPINPRVIELEHPFEGYNSVVLLK
jgi:hypothetical protein